jgi:hypothetical protein
VPTSPARTRTRCSTSSSPSGPGAARRAGRPPARSACTLGAAPKPVPFACAFTRADFDPWFRTAIQPTPGWTALAVELPGSGPLLDHARSWEGADLPALGVVAGDREHHGPEEVARLTCPSPAHLESPTCTTEARLRRDLVPFRMAGIGLGRDRSGGGGPTARRPRSRRPTSGPTSSARTADAGCTSTPWTSPGSHRPPSPGSATGCPYCWSACASASAVTGSPTSPSGVGRRPREHAATSSSSSATRHGRRAHAAGRLPVGALVAVRGHPPRGGAPGAGRPRPRGRCGTARVLHLDDGLLAAAGYDVAGRPAGPRALRRRVDVAVGPPAGWGEPPDPVGDRAARGGRRRPRSYGSWGHRAARGGRLPTPAVSGQRPSSATASHRGRRPRPGARRRCRCTAAPAGRGPSPGDVLAAASPGGLAAGATGGLAAHRSAPFRPPRRSQGGGHSASVRTSERSPGPLRSHHTSPMTPTSTTAIAIQLLRDNPKYRSIRVDAQGLDPAPADPVADQVDEQQRAAALERPRAIEPEDHHDQSEVPQRLVQERRVEGGPGRVAGALGDAVRVDRQRPGQVGRAGRTAPG